MGGRAVTRGLRGLWLRLDMWWGLHGQFSRPVRLVSARRRAAHERVEARCAEPGCREAALRRLTDRIGLRDLGIGGPLPMPSEAELFRRIFGCEPGRGVGG
ncbi:hypothetical protein GCM10010193_12280 [Kitasatospora atroaurantiaca]